MQEEDLERSFYITSSRFSDKPGVAAHRVFVEIEHNYFNNPISKGEVKNNTSFKNFKGGSQGTNFSSTKEEYDAIIKLKEQNNKQYWIYAPGENADLWEDFYEAGIMGLGWNQLGDLNKYASKKEIKEKLQNLENTKSSKKNDASANFEFAREMKPRDIVIVKSHAEYSDLFVKEYNPDFILFYGW
ncbi:hypothetical protein HOD02_03590, partial [bacterium]|nr:hypothetical protein [bacterium]